MAKRRIDIIVRGRDQGASTVLNRVGGGVDRLTGQLFSFRGAAIGALAAFFGGRALGQTLKTIDNLAKTADKLGVTTEELGALRFAADLTGVAANTLDMAIQRMTRRISEAADGSGEAKAAIRELGLDAKQLEKLGAAKAFEEITGAMSRVPDQSDRVRLAFKLFDSEGVALVNTLALGKQGLADAAEEAANLGLIMDRETAASAERANDAITRVKAAALGLSQTIVVSAAPVIEGLANFVATKAIPFFEDWGGTIVKTGIVVVGLVGVLKTIVVAQRSIAQAQRVLLALAGPKGWAILAGAALVGAVSYAAVSNAFDAIESSADSAMKAAQRANKEIGGLGGAGEVTPSSIDLSGRSSTVREIREEIARLDDAFESAKQRMRQFDEDSKRAFDARDVEATRAANEAVNQALHERDEAFAAIGRAKAALATAEERLATDVEKLNASLAQQVAMFGQSSSAVKIYELATKGASQEQLALAEATAKQLDEMKRQAEVATSVANVTDRLREQIDTFGLGADQVELYRLAVQGATEEQLELVRATQEQLGLLKTQRGLQDRADRFRGALQTPEERFADRAKELTELFQEGLFDTAEFVTLLDRLTNASFERREPRERSPLNAVESRFLTRAPQGSGRTADPQADTATNTKKSAESDKKREKLAQTTVDKLTELVDRMPVIRVARI